MTLSVCMDGAAITGIGQLIPRWHGSPSVDPRVELDTGDVASLWREKAATRIQARVRGMLIRKRFCALIKYRARLCNSVRKIQAHARGAATRAMYRRLRVRLRESAVVSVQCAWRGSRGRLVASEVRAASHRSNEILRCVVKIQSAARMRFARRSAECMRRTIGAARAAAVLDIQRWAKGFVARSEVRTLRLALEPVQGLFMHAHGRYVSAVVPWAWQMWAAPWGFDSGGLGGQESGRFVDLFSKVGLGCWRDAAATRLEAAARGLIARRRCVLRRRELAARRLQAAARSMISWHRCKAVSTLLQATVLDTITQRNRAHIRGSIVVSIVEAIASEASDVLTLRMWAAIVIQSAVRCRLVRKQRILDRLHDEHLICCAEQIVTVQAHLGRFVAQAWLESAFVTERSGEAATVIQAWLRGWIARRTRQRLLSEALWPLKGWFEYTATGRDAVQAVVRFIPNPNFDTVRHLATHCSAGLGQLPCCVEASLKSKRDKGRGHRNADALRPDSRPTSAAGSAPAPVAVAADSEQTLSPEAAVELLAYGGSARPGTPTQVSPLPSAEFQDCSDCREAATAAGFDGASVAPTSSEAVKRLLPIVGACRSLILERERQFPRLRNRKSLCVEKRPESLAHKFLIEAAQQWQGLGPLSQDQSHSSCASDAPSPQDPKPPKKPSPSPPPLGLSSIRDISAGASASAVRRSQSLGALKDRPSHCGVLPESGKNFMRDRARMIEDLSDAKMEEVAEDFGRCQAEQRADVARKQRQRRKACQDPTRRTEKEEDERKSVHVLVEDNSIERHHDQLKKLLKQKDGDGRAPKTRDNAMIPQVLDKQLQNMEPLEGLVSMNQGERQRRVHPRSARVSQLRRAEDGARSKTIGRGKTCNGAVVVNEIGHGGRMGPDLDRGTHSQLGACLNFDAPPWTASPCVTDKDGVVGCYVATVPELPRILCG